jgi:hypothetical protein
MKTLCRILALLTLLAAAACEKDKVEPAFEIYGESIGI